MHAITIPEPGGPEALVWDEVPDPVAGPGEVLVEVVAGAVNRADILQRQGFYNPRPAPPLPRSRMLRPDRRARRRGERLGRRRRGLRAALRRRLRGAGRRSGRAAAARPRGLTVDQAAALPEVVCTVWSNVFMVAHLRPGETLLVHGGSSGIGTMAIQLAKAVGARVAVTAGTAEKLERCAELGADILVNYREQDFVDELERATGGTGADVILDNMGARYLDRNVRALAVNGRLAIIGMQGGVKGS
ncbi:hypothetical protein SHKM778_00740 [Streptomyces sp. KM77-8]|uniref:Enoyl reductase (ER) domain-containing protein n=1 Tax=Streptomyces haneummycinicus TaxID=3074435 RepID=A0AAT9H8G8_9ACTN